MVQLYHVFTCNELHPFAPGLWTKYIAIYLAKKLTIYLRSFLANTKEYENLNVTVVVGMSLWKILSVVIPVAPSESGPRRQYLFSPLLNVEHNCSLMFDYNLL